MLANEDKKFLLKLARITLENKESDLSDIPQALLEKGATFVSLYKNQDLINSIGSLKPSMELFQDVIDNIHSFPIEEKENVKIEISVINNFKKLSFESEQELFSQIIQNKHGIAIEKDKKIATLLPFIWNQVNDKEEFLNQVCYKLRLPKDSWKKNAEIYVYEAETFRETG